MKKNLLVIAIFISQNLIAQQESWNWNFGNNAGVNFSTGAPVSFTGSALSTMEGTASISDNSGNLLFYTDGITVYDNQNNAMPNGIGLLGHPSSTQSAIILKQPGSSTIYFVFTMDYNHDGQAIGDGFRYSNVDMSLNGGLGDVTNKNVLIRLPVYEKLIAVCDGNGTDFWVLINDWANDDIFSYHLTSAGLNTIPVMSNISPIHNGDIALTTGYMKASAQGDKLVLSLWNNNSYDLFNYDNTTGIASNHITVQSNDMNWTYGAEFSPDGTKLYGTKLNAPCSLYQFDITSWNPTTILNSRVILGSNPNTYYYCAMQTGPDGKIYCGINNTSTLGVINDPNLSGTACNYVNSAVSLNGHTCKYGLPTFAPCYVIPSGINTVENEIETDIYPNPASSELNISFNENVKTASYKLTDVTGKLLSQSKISTKNFQLDIDCFKSGIYFLNLFEKNKLIKSEKILIF